MSEGAQQAVPMLWRRLVGARERALKGGPLAFLDVGSTKLCCYIARLKGQGGFVLAGRGYQLAAGFKGGEVVDADEAEISILAAMQEAELQAGEQLREVAIGWSGGSPASRLVRVTVPLHGRPVHDDDVRECLEAARADGVGPGREAVHVLPVEARIDDGRPLRDPRGLAGGRLAMTVAVASVASPPLRDLLGCLERCHLQAYAAGVACLTQDEAQRGCLVLDLGGGTTGLALFHGGRMAFAAQVPYGGDHVTHDVALGLSTTTAFAERVKALYGGVQARSCDDNMRLAVPLVAGSHEATTGEVPRRRLTHIIRARAEEILVLAQERLQDAGDLLKHAAPRGVVVTGGGAQTEGMAELVEEVFDLPARVGCPALVQGALGVESQPCCSAASGGLALLAGDDGGFGWRGEAGRAPITQGLARFGQWLKQNFAT